MNYDEFVVAYHTEQTPRKFAAMLGLLDNLQWEKMLEHVVECWVPRYHREMDESAEAMVHAYMVVFMDMDLSAVFVEAVEELLGHVPDWLEENGDWGYLRAGIDTEFLVVIASCDNFEGSE